MSCFNHVHVSEYRGSNDRAKKTKCSCRKDETDEVLYEKYILFVIESLSEHYRVLSGLDWEHATQTYQFYSRRFISTWGIVSTSVVVDRLELKCKAKHLDVLLDNICSEIFTGGTSYCMATPFIFSTSFYFPHTYTVIFILKKMNTIKRTTKALTDQHFGSTSLWNASWNNKKFYGRNRFQFDVIIDFVRTLSFIDSILRFNKWYLCSWGNIAYRNFRTCLIWLHSIRFKIDFVRKICLEFKNLLCAKICLCWRFVVTVLGFQLYKSENF